jgi:hypothetical protein
MMKAVEIGSGAMICIPSFIHIGSGVQKSIEGDTHRHTDSKYYVLDIIHRLAFF